MSKNVINEIKTLLGIQVKLEQMKLDNGTLIEAEVFEPNQEVFIVNEEERVALPIGEYILEDGRVLIVAEEGIIAEIKEQEAPEEAPEEEPRQEPEQTSEEVSEHLAEQTPEEVSEELPEESAEQKGQEQEREEGEDKIKSKNDSGEFGNFISDIKNDFLSKSQKVGGKKKVSRKKLLFKDLRKLSRSKKNR